MAEDLNRWKQAAAESAAALVADGMICTFGPIAGTQALANELDHIVGLVEHGLFIGLTTEVHVGGAGGVRVLTSARESRSLQAEQTRRHEMARSEA